MRSRSDGSSFQGLRPDRTLNVPCGSGSTRGRTRDRFVNGQSRMLRAESSLGASNCAATKEPRSTSRTWCFPRFVDVASRGVLRCLLLAGQPTFPGRAGSCSECSEGNEASSAVARRFGCLIRRYGTIRLRRNLHGFPASDRYGNRRRSASLSGCKGRRRMLDLCASRARRCQPTDRSVRAAVGGGYSS